MKASYDVGVDISKGQLDWQVNDPANHPVSTGRTANRPAGIDRMLAEWKRRGLSPGQLVVCFEHTGPYGLLLAVMLEEAGMKYVMVAAAQVQRSLGIRRGKSDPVDAGRLAEYLWRFRDQLRPSRLPSGALLELRGWLLWREKLVKMRTSLANGIQAHQLTSQVVDLSKIIIQMQQCRSELDEQLHQVDRTIKDLLTTCQRLKGQYRLLVSIGPVIAGWLLARRRIYPVRYRSPAGLFYRKCPVSPPFRHPTRA